MRCFEVHLSNPFSLVWICLCCWQRLRFFRLNFCFGLPVSASYLGEGSEDLILVHVGSVCAIGDW